MNKIASISIYAEDGMGQRLDCDAVCRDLKEKFPLFEFIIAKRDKTQEERRTKCLQDYTCYLERVLTNATPQSTHTMQ